MTECHFRIKYMLARSDGVTLLAVPVRLQAKPCIFNEYKTTKIK